MAQYIITLKAPATVEGALTVEAPDEEQAKALAIQRVGQVIWTRTGTNENKVEVVRSYQIPSR